MLPGRGGSAVEFFGTVGHGNKIVFILDVSGSMDENAYSGQGRRVTRFERARQELVRSISQLYSDQEFAVLLFSSDCRPMFDLPQNKVQFLAATSRHKQQFKHWLASIQPAGGTDPRTSLEVALALYPDAIFLLTDGEFRVGRDGPIGKAVIRLVRNLNTHRIPIHTIAYQDQRSRHTLETIAEDSGGTFRFVK
jgi:Mg-chelatase subunit ChlD